MRDGGLTKKLFRGALFQVIILQTFINGVPFDAHVTHMCITEQLLLCDIKSHFESIKFDVTIKFILFSISLSLLSVLESVKLFF